MNRDTQFSECRKYRYTLWRQWDDLNDGYAMFIGLNPSTADETKDDPTIRRCVGFAKSWGYGALCMTNLFAFRATDPKVMKSHPNPVGLHNQHHLLQCASSAGVVIAAWGNHGSHRHQDLTVRSWLSGIGVTLRALKISVNGMPSHPLYLSKALTPILLPQ